MSSSSSSSTDTRTSVEEVKRIIETDLDDPTIDSYIEAANIMVSAILARKGLGSCVLAEIERWVAAHMIASTRERQSKKEEAGGAKIEYTGVYGIGLNLTSYGQMAISLDTSRTLAALTGKAASIKAIKE